MLEQDEEWKVTTGLRERSRPRLVGGMPEGSRAPRKLIY